MIKDGVLVGDFENLYGDHNDPWHQSKKTRTSSDIAVILNYLKQHKVEKLVEIGCGHGHLSKQIFELGVDVLGTDISRNAISKARALYPDITFREADILDLDVYREFKPEVFLLSDVTWYILDKLDDFIRFLRCYEKPILMHFLTLYPKGVQQYGREKFTTLEEILDYFQADYDEFGLIALDGGNKFDTEKLSYFIGTFNTT